MAHWTTTAWTRRLPLALAAALACAAGAAFARPQPGVEDLGVMVEAATPEHRFLARLPSGETHLLLFFTRKSYATTPFQIVDVDLSTGRARTVEGVPGRPGTNATVLHSGGQLYVGTAQPGGWMRYDPATGRAEALGRLADNGAHHAVEGSDGALYVGQSGRATVQRFDPRAGRLETVGRADGGVAAGTRYAYTLGGDGRWVYVASGHAPWSLVVFDRARGTQARFLEGEGLRWLEVFRRPDGWYATALLRDGGRRVYALRDGRPAPLAPGRAPAPPDPRWGLCPVGTDEEAATCRARFGVEVDLSGAVARAGAPARVRWRRGGGPWREASAPVATEPVDVSRLFAGADGRLLGFGAFYGPAFTYDPAAGRRRVLGQPFVSVYDAVEAGGAWYVAGYPTALLRYDPARAWTLEAAPTGGGAANPRLVAGLRGADAAKHFRRAAAAGGVVWLGGHHERGSEGGSLAWHDPGTGRGGQLRAPFARHDVSDLAAAAGGSLVVFSGRAVGEGGEGRLFVVDARGRRVAGDFAPLPGARDAGRIVEVRPGVVVGIVDAPRPRVYAADVRARRVLYARDLPLSRGWKLPLRLARGPDGGVWLMDGTALVRVDPADGRLERVRDLGVRGELLFAGRDLYLYGDARLRRVRGLF